MPWFDHHCHLTPGEEAAAAVAAARAAGVAALVVVGCDEASTADGLAVAAAHPAVVWATAGVHPHEARHGWAWLDAVLATGAVVAVGEAGLDYHYDHSPRAAQRDSFAAQIGLAHHHGLPLVIHTREAWEDTFAILDREGTPARTVFHCFTGGPDEASACLVRGAHLSFSGIVSFKAAADVAAAARLCPLDRLLVETDSPYLAPVPHRGKRNQPAWVVHVGAAVAAVKGLTPGEVQAATWATTTRFYDLDPNPGP
jgi:TatD DNase family protein